MNIVELSENLKAVPDDYLVNHVKQPDGSVPQFMALSELQRRQDMRQRFASQPPATTVSDDILARQRSQGMGGIASGVVPSGGAPVPNPGAGTSGPVGNPNAGIAAAQPQGYATGGMVFDPFTGRYNEPLPPDDGFDYDYYAKLLDPVEGGGDYNAQSDRSSAHGRYQFINSTYRKYAPKAGVDPSDRSPQAQDRVFRAFTGDNVAALTQNGLPATPSNAYALHLLGQSGGTDFLSAAQADPHTSIHKHFSDTVIDNNPLIFRGARTLGDVQKRLAGMFPDKPAPPPAWQTALSNGVDRFKQFATALPPSHVVNLPEDQVTREAAPEAARDGGIADWIAPPAWGDSYREAPAPAQAAEYPLPLNASGQDHMDFGQSMLDQRKVQPFDTPDWGNMTLPMRAANIPYGVMAGTAAASGDLMRTIAGGFQKGVGWLDREMTQTPNQINAALAARGQVPPGTPNAVPMPTAADITGDQQAPFLQLPSSDALNQPVPANTPNTQVDQHDDLAEQLAQMYAQGLTSKDERRNMALLKAGLGIAGGTSPWFATNVGQGAMAGVSDWEQSGKENTQAGMDYLGTQMKLRELQNDQRYRDATLDISKQNLEISRDRANSYAMTSLRRGVPMAKLDDVTRIYEQIVKAKSGSGLPLSDADSQAAWNQALARALNAGNLGIGGSSAPPTSVDVDHSTADQ